MEAPESLLADEVLSSSQSSQEGDFYDERPKEKIMTRGMMLRSSGVKRRRESEPKAPQKESSVSKKKGRKFLTSSSDNIEKDFQISSPSTETYKPIVSRVTAPESCSLFSSILLSWSMGSSRATNGTHLSFVNHPQKTKNGIWLKWNLPWEKELFVLVELRERSVKPRDNELKDQLVAFCNGKCGQKKSEVISLQEKRIRPDENGVFEAVVQINEQCAHRSENGYGAPNTRFYIHIQLLDREADGRFVQLAAAESGLIKVVAPGKSKPPKKDLPKKEPKKDLKKEATKKESTKKEPTKKETTKKAKQSMVQLMDKFLLTIQSFDERLTQLEKKMDANFNPNFNYFASPPPPPPPSTSKPKEEFKVHELSNDSVNYPSIYDDSSNSSSSIKREPKYNLRQSCEFGIPNNQEEFLSLSQEVSLMIPDA
eukprot:TRINITY_DN56_c0_g1_i1.p1 TRINITY_DN56_c0_g1~~TRINITY_DN56_c0_g1_i1.p1  ORF type:complete len:434 (-),score=107.20 TRINITY_DN56_c0_g1_i1:117-1394(-)